MNYAPLHVHTDASSDGAGTVESLVKRAKEIECTHLSMTDHGTLANAVSFWSACEEQEIIPILGMEAYLSYRGKRHHVTLLSLNEGGFENLTTMSSLAYEKHYDGGYPIINLDMLHTYRNGLFALTGCASSAIHEGLDENGLIYVQDLVESIGEKYVAVEVMSVGSPGMRLFLRAANIPIENWLFRACSRPSTSPAWWNPGA
jgi:DNA polymerase-3 subunit alpha